MVLAAIGQICSTASMSHNLAQCRVLVKKAVDAGAKALFLPEASDYISLTPSESLSLCQSTTTSPFVQGLQSLARQNALNINVGIHEPTVPPSDRVRNTLVWIDRKGNIAHRYQKLHVFDVDLRESGGPVLKESASTEPGGKEEIKEGIWDLEHDEDEHGDRGEDRQKIKFGSLICFDLRFPEASLSLRRLGADVLLYPSAFTVPTGKLHWEVLLRARAIENQCWVIAAAQCGRHNEKRVSYGEAMVVDPNGTVKGRMERVEDAEGEVVGAREPGLFLVDLEMGIGERVRRGMPLKRRGDVYGIV